MRKYRSIYLCLFILTLLALLLQEKKIYAFILIIEVALPIILKLMLKHEARKLELEITMEHSMVRKRPFLIQIKAKSKSPFLVAGLIRFSANSKNALYGVVQHELIDIPIKRKGTDYSFYGDMIESGVRVISFHQAAIYDLLGLSAVNIKLPETEVVSVYPEEMKLGMIQDMTHMSNSTEGNFDRNVKGRDMSEVSDIRDYAAGDDIRSIHWKLSSKLDSLVVKEASAATYLDTMVMVDIARVHDNLLTDDAYERAIQITAAVSEELTKSGVRHFLCIPAQNNLKMMPVTNEATRMEALSTMLGEHFSESEGKVLRLFESVQNEYRFTRIIYITVRALPDELELIESSSRVTAICVSDEESEIAYLRTYNKDIMYVPSQGELSEDFNIRY